VGFAVSPNVFWNFRDHRSLKIGTGLGTRTDWPPCSNWTLQVGLESQGPEVGHSLYGYRLVTKEIMNQASVGTFGSSTLAFRWIANLYEFYVSNLNSFVNTGWC
jgi:hypothetical protein